jgi:hypothetical protein
LLPCERVGAADRAGICRLRYESSSSSPPLRILTAGVDPRAAGTTARKSYRERDIRRRLFGRSSTAPAV